MANIDIASLFSDIVPDPAQQQRERTLQQNDAVNQANLVGTLGGMAAYLAPQRSRALQQSATGLLGIEQPTSAADQVKAQLAAASSQKQTPDSLIRLAKLVENTDPQKAAQFRQAAAQMQAGEAEQVRQQSYRDTVARRAANSPRFRSDVKAIIDGTLPQTEIDRIYSELTKEEEVQDLEPLQLILPDGNQQTAFYDDKGNFYDVTDPTKQLTLAEGTQVLRSSQVGAGADYANPRERALFDAQLGTARFTSSANNVLKALDDNKDSNTAVGRLAGTFNSLAQEAEALLNIKNEGDRRKLFEGAGLDLGRQSSAMQSMIIGLAYQAAAAEGQVGRAATEPDIQRFMRQLGADSSDPVALANNIRRLKTAAQEDFSNRYYATRNERWQGSFEPITPAPSSEVAAPVPAGTPNFNL